MPGGEIVHQCDCAPPILMQDYIFRVGLSCWVRAHWGYYTCACWMFACLHLLDALRTLFVQSLRVRKMGVLYTVSPQSMHIS